MPTKLPKLKKYIEAQREYIEAQKDPVAYLINGLKELEKKIDSKITKEV